MGRNVVTVTRVPVTEVYFMMKDPVHYTTTWVVVGVAALGLLIETTSNRKLNHTASVLYSTVTTVSLPTPGGILCEVSSMRMLNVE